jgi:hypothetical protein
MSQRQSGFGVGFSKEVDSILAAGQLGHLYPDEVRENLRIAGMVLGRTAEMGEFVAYEPDDPGDAVGLNDEQGEDDA